MVKKQPYFSIPIYLNVLFIILLGMLLASCSSRVKRQDGPPNFYVDETKIPNAKPKLEPLSKYGNMRSYTVFGRRYYPMKSSHSYQAIGTASWYGTKFHARRTSSGERYNMLSMTAAHKTLPLPTYVEVTNLKNQRKIIVKVNDRGPFESNRLIDLSYVAAKKLGMLGRGTAPVKVKAIDPRTYLKPNPSTFLASTKQSWKTSVKKVRTRVVKLSTLIYLQVGAFKQKLHAERLKHRLAFLTTPVKITQPNTSHGLYRVHLGPFRDENTLKKMSRRLKSIGIKPIVYPVAIKKLKSKNVYGMS